LYILYLYIYINKFIKEDIIFYEIIDIIFMNRQRALCTKYIKCQKLRSNHRGLMGDASFIKRLINAYNNNASNNIYASSKCSNPWKNVNILASRKTNLNVNCIYATVFIHVILARTVQKCRRAADS